MKIQNNKYALTSFIFGFIALLFSFYTSISEDMNDGRIETPYLFFEITSALSEKQVPKVPEMSDIKDDIQFVDEEKKIVIYSIASLFIAASIITAIASIRRKQISLFPAIGAFFCVSSIIPMSLLASILFALLFFFWIIIEQKNTKKQLENNENLSSCC